MKLSGSMNFIAENGSQLVATLRSIDIIGPLMREGLKSIHTEAYAVAHLLSSIAEEEGPLTFPLELVHR